MKRRDFIATIGAAAAWPLAAGAQERERRIGVLINLAADDAEAKRRLSSFIRALMTLGWIDGHNLRIEARWGGGSPDRISKQASEIIALAPDVILASGDSTLGPILRETRTIPVVFVIVPDPVGAGFVDSLSHPGRNATGFTNIEFGTSAKWLELLKHIAPYVQKVGVLRDPSIPSGIGQWGAIQAIAPSLNVELQPLDIRDAQEIERTITTFAQFPNRALITVTSAIAISHRDEIIALAARHQLPAVYPYRVFAESGGLISYGPDLIDQYRQAAGYIDRILKGEQPAEMPVQAPTKYELIVNLRTAKALGITMPPSLLATADESID
ncbi:MAG TPA: ABC transporter substrate-binding protein [Xanthobacteraceae bacterium]|jgi:putative ABC transport system substrate-binding protein|nr:ABC transporter substrate-binding protein [Xanthobacteraceae bacterium]